MTTHDRGVRFNPPKAEARQLESPGNKFSLMRLF